MDGVVTSGSTALTIRSTTRAAPRGSSGSMYVRILSTSAIAGPLQRIFTADAFAHAAVPSS